MKQKTVQVIWKVVVVFMLFATVAWLLLPLFTV